MDRASIFWRWALALLVVCNLALMATIWLQPQLHRAPTGPPESTRDFVIRKLKFSGQQVKTYDSLVALHRNTMTGLDQKSRSYHKLLFSSLRYNNSPADSLARLIGDNQQQIEMATYLHFKAVRALCDSGQKVVFDETLDDILKRMRTPEHPRRGADHGDGPPPPPGDGPPPPGPDGPPPPPPEGR